MFRLLGYLLWLALGLGIAEVGAKAVLEMAGKAAYAHQHDQISYSKWNKMLWEAKPISPLRPPKQKRKP